MRWVRAWKNEKPRPENLNPVGANRTRRRTRRIDAREVVVETAGAACIPRDRRSRGQYGVVRAMLSLLLLESGNPLGGNREAPRCVGKLDQRSLASASVPDTIEQLAAGDHPVNQGVEVSIYHYPCPTM